MTDTTQPILEALSGGLGWILFLVQVLGILLAVRVVMSERSTAGTIAWTIALASLAPLAVPLYAFFGRNRFSGYRRARRARNHEIRQAMRELDRLKPAELSAPGQPRSGWRVMERLAQLPFTRDNQVTLLIDGEATFGSILEGIRAARYYVLVEFYILRDDALGRRLRDALLERARAGVRVHLIYDEIGSHATARGYFESLRNGGVRVTEFGTTRGGWARRLRLNFRNHRKIVIVDGRVGWLGGHNVGDEYLGNSPEYGPWRDTHLRVEGPAVVCLQVPFLEDWYWATGHVPGLQWEPHDPDPNDDGVPVLILPSGPADERDTYALALLHAINQARERLWIHSPYFAPDEEIVAALQLATLRGVDVRILIPERPDHRLVWLASFHFLNLPALRQVKFFRYQPGFLHSKVVLIDSRYAAVGSANLDNRSLRINFEATAIVADHAFAAQVATMMERDFAQARPVDHREYERRPLAFRVAVRAVRLLSPVL